MANPEQLEILKQGVKVWNDWRVKNPIKEPDLVEADLKAADLGRANLSGAILHRANLPDANLSYANLNDADLSDANLSDADLSGARLKRTNLSNAILYWTDLTYADLSNAIIEGAYIGRTIFGATNLTDVIGLDSCDHARPSIIDHYTLAKSGTLPRSFLRGCGLPDKLIEFLLSLLDDLNQFYSCFISHSTKDQRFCDRLFADLQNKGIRTWYFPENAKWGESVWGEIDRSIRVYDKLVVVCSKNSLHSGPVLREIERSLNREDREGKSILFPIRIDNYIFDGWQHERKDDLLRKVIGDFSSWKNPDAYQKAFDRLLRDLKAKVAPS